MIRKYHNHNLQKNLCHLEEEPHNNHKTPGRQTKQSKQLPLPHQDDCKARMDTQNIEQLQNPTMGVTINNESTTTELFFSKINFFKKFFQEHYQSVRQAVWIKIWVQSVCKGNISRQQKSLLGRKELSLCL